MVSFFVISPRTLLACAFVPSKRFSAIACSAGSISSPVNERIEFVAVDVDLIGGGHGRIVLLISAPISSSSAPSPPHPAPPRTTPPARGQGFAFLSVPFLFFYPPLRRPLLP